MPLDRRIFLQRLAASLSVFSVSPVFKSAAEEPNILAPLHQFDFKNTNDRVWLNKSLWSIPMEDWRVQNGRVEFDGKVKNSRVNFLTLKLKEGNGFLQLKANAGLIKKENNESTIGFEIGLRDSTDPDNLPAACYFGKGIEAGVSIDGHIYIGEEIMLIEQSFDFKNFEMELKAETQENITEVLFSIKDRNGLSAEISSKVYRDVNGWIALKHTKSGSSFWWNNISVTGSKVLQKKVASYGPILWSMYTLHNKTLKLTAQLPPIGSKDNQEVSLLLKKGSQWHEVQVQKVHRESFTTTFRIDDWQSSHAVDYKLVYELDKETHSYEGLIRNEPSSEKLKLGALTCQNGSGFPYRPLVENLEKTNPDILYFSGDQIYEENGGYPIKREPEEKAILSYLGKWYMFGWAFGNVMRDRPTICTPDDHDVFQGNLWGEGGNLVTMEEWEAKRDARGGYVQTAKMVNVVNRTQCQHLPDPYLNELLPSGISTWFTHLCYGGVSFAIVSDRMFKSGPEMIRKGDGRIDHVTDRLDGSELESELLEMMGNPQMEFLKNWVEDWKDASMKVLLSQTLFANVATHHGPKKEFLFGDLDSGGWPKKQRDEVLRLMQKAAVFHINGDQHLPFIVQYSIDEKRDGGYTYCTPAIATGYPRWSKPDELNIPFTDRPDHGLKNTGLYQDIFGNKNFVYAVGNPEEDIYKEKNRYLLAQKKASGFGIILFDLSQRTIKMEAIRFLADLSKSTPSNTFPGWPHTINQLDNDGRTAIGYLPIIKTNLPNQLLRIYKQKNNELVTAIRLTGREFRPPVFENLTYKVVLGQDDSVVKENVEITNDPEEELKV